MTTIRRNMLSGGLRTTLLCLVLLPLLMQHICAWPHPNVDAESTSAAKAAGATTIHTTNTVPAADDDDNSDDEPLTETASQRMNLLIFTLDEFVVLSNFTVQRAVEIFRNVLKDAATLNETSDALSEHLKNFTKFIERAERTQQLSDTDHMTELYEMVVQFAEIVESHNTTMPENNSTENLYLEMSLKKNGLDKLEVDFLEKFSHFAVRFNNLMDKYVELLTAEERKQDSDFIKWYNKLKHMPDSEDKLEFFAKFFNHY